MDDTIVLIQFSEQHQCFIDDLTQVMDHSYDIDEIYLLYPDWVKKKMSHVDEYCGMLFPPTVKESEDDFIALRNAITNLYCAIDRTVTHLGNRCITHVAFDDPEGVLAVSIR